MTENERFIFCNKTTDSNVWDTLEKQCYGWEYVVSLLNSFDDIIKDLSEKNEQLKKRNENQYNQLTELWEIIEEENWEKLIAMKKQLKEDEERLQNEWRCYDD